MATLHIEMFSPSLCRSADFYVLIPNDLPVEARKENPHYARPVKTLFLLHGYTGNNRDWLIRSSVQELSGKYNLAVVLPSGENSFYVDAGATGHQYHSLIAKDILGYVRSTLGLAMEPQDTFIGGLSMGGFGALHIGLSHPDAFSRIIALSAALIVGEVAQMCPDGAGNALGNYAYYQAVFGDPSTVLGSDRNPETLVKRLLQNRQPVPGIYLACGTEDSLIESNRMFGKFLSANGIDARFVEKPGMHDWKFWNERIEPAICWALDSAE